MENKRVKTLQELSRIVQDLKERERLDDVFDREVSAKERLQFLYGLNKGIIQRLRRDWTGVDYCLNGKEEVNDLQLFLDDLKNL